MGAVNAITDLPMSDTNFIQLCC